MFRQPEIYSQNLDSTAFYLSLFLSLSGTAAILGFVIRFVAMKKDIYTYVAPSTTTTTIPQPVYKHGECDWLPAMALKAGWPVNQLGTLKKTALRESGCCPNRRGGDMVDKDCNITGVSEWSHRSDSGLLQNNGINWDLSRNPYAPVCLQIKICTQEPLLDALTNLKAGLLLFRVTGSDWSPWIVPEGGW